jgi:L-glutamine-phosphate cytidylyltransferase
MKAIILAAGRGSRMKGLTESNPKCLVEVDGKPLLEHQLNALRGAGITDIAIVTGYKPEMLSFYKLTEFHNPRWSDTNMVSSLCCAQSWLQDSECIISYSDIFYDTSAITSLINIKSDIAITYDPNWLAIWKDRFDDPLSDAETFRINAKNELLEIGNHPHSVQEVEGQYMGLLKFTPKGWSCIEMLRQTLSPALQDKMHMTGTLQKIVESTISTIETVPYFGRWGEVDSEEDLVCYQ